VSSAVTPRIRRPPGLYRLARAFRRTSVIVLVVVILFVGTVAYSAVELVRDSPRSGGYSAGFEPNGTVELTGSFELSNPGLYPLSGLSVSMRIQNSTGSLIGAVGSGPTTLGAGATATIPIALYLSAGAGGPAGSLLVTDQYLTVGFWGNATYAYLFPVSVHFDQNKSWGAPFENFAASVGEPTVEGSLVSVPVTISFSNHAGFTEAGTLMVVLDSTGGTSCGQTSFSLNVAPGSFYSETQSFSLASGCSLSGGSVDATFVEGGSSIALPPEPIP
jgi:hypothetical protein